MNSALYIFEGPDGVGKSTLALHLNDHLEKRGFTSKLLSFPGREDGTLGEHIYRLYHDPSSFGIQNISVVSEQLLFAAAHAEVIENQVLPALAAGWNVVLDRYWWSTWVYSTIGNLDSEIRDLLIEVELKLWRKVNPTCIFLVHRGQSPSSEHSTEKWHKLVSLYNDVRLKQTDQRIIDVDNAGDLIDTLQFIFKLIPGHCRLPST